MILHHVHISNVDNDAIARKCYEIMNTEAWQNTYDPNDDVTGKETRQSHALSAYETYANPHTWPEFAPILELLPKLITPHLVHRSWFAVSSYNGSIKEHVHNDRIDSGELCDKYVAAYYVKRDTDHSPFEYFDNGIWKSINPVTGDLIIFTCDLLHRVPASLSKTDRISIALNI